MSYASDMQSLKGDVHGRRNGIFVIDEEVISHMTTDESTYQLRFLLRQRFRASMKEFVGTLDRMVCCQIRGLHPSQISALEDLEMGQIAKDIAASVSEAMFGPEGEVLGQLRRLQKELLPARISALRRELGRMEDALNAMKAVCVASGDSFHQTYFETEPYIQLLAENTPPQLEELLERSHARLADLTTTFSRHKISDSYNKDKLDRADDVFKWVRLNRAAAASAVEEVLRTIRHTVKSDGSARCFSGVKMADPADTQLDMTALLSVRGALVPLPMPRHLDADARKFVAVAEADSGYCCRAARVFYLLTRMTQLGRLPENIIGERFLSMLIFESETMPPPPPPLTEAEERVFEEIDELCGSEPGCSNGSSARWRRVRPPGLPENLTIDFCVFSACRVLLCKPRFDDVFSFSIHDVIREASRFALQHRSVASEYLMEKSYERARLSKVGVILTKLEKLVNKTTRVGLSYEAVERRTTRVKPPKHVTVRGRQQIADFEKFLVAAALEMRNSPDSWNVKWFDTPRKLKRANERSYGRLDRNPRSPQSSTRSGSASASK